MGFEKKIAIRPVPRESERKLRAKEVPVQDEKERSLEDFFEYKTGDIQELKDMLKTLMLALSTQDFETFCDNTPDKEALLKDFMDRKAASEAPGQYGYITYAFDLLRETAGKKTTD